MPSILQRGSRSELPGQSCRALPAGGYGEKVPGPDLSIRSNPLARMLESGRSLREVPVSSRFRVHRTRTATKLIISILIIVRARAIKAFGLATASLHWRLSADGRLHFGIL